MYQTKPISKWLCRIECNTCTEFHPNLLCAHLFADRLANAQEDMAKLIEAFRFFSLTEDGFVLYCFLL
jgi:hypothetical protein